MASTSTTAAAAMATRARPRRDEDGVSPGASTLSRTDAPTSETKPNDKKMARPASIQPSAGGIPSFCVAILDRGTVTVPRPAGPSTATLTAYDPRVMSQSCELKSAESVGTRSATSGAGAPREPTFHCAAWVVTLVTTPSRTRTVIWARPGTMPGGRTVTWILYGPAIPEKKASSVPTCALATSVPNVMASNAPARLNNPHRRMSGTYRLTLRNHRAQAAPSEADASDKPKATPIPRRNAAPVASKFAHTPL